mgnify:CR=1 FL=1
MREASAVVESSKTFTNFPCAHRRHRHKGHCSLVHGYSRAFTFWFRCTHPTDNGFVMDFGDLKPVKAWLKYHFDHTLLLDSDDPLLPMFRLLHSIEVRENDKNSARVTRGQHHG